MGVMMNTTESKTMNLYQRINEVRKLINYVQKDKSVGTGGGSYKAVTHDQVTGMVREHMVKHGIISYPVLVDSLSNPKEVNAAMETAKQFRYEATYDIVFVNAEEPSDTLTIRIQAHAMDNADKAPGKALSYAKKYAILKLFEIETGEDEESRYQDNTEPFDLAFHVEAMTIAGDLDDLKAAYMAANQEATKAKDSASLKALTKLKDELKAKLA
jgi:hypothetical protein